MLARPNRGIGSEEMRSNREKAAASWKQRNASESRIYEGPIAAERANEKETATKKA